MRFAFIAAALAMTLSACTVDTNIPDAKNDGGGAKAAKGGKGKGKDAKGKGKGKKGGKVATKGKGKGKGKGGKMKGKIGKNSEWDDGQTCCRYKDAGQTTYHYGSKKECNNRKGKAVQGGDDCLLICCKNGGNIDRKLKGNCKGKLVPDKTCGA